MAEKVTGSTVGEYVIERELGQGAFGVVYRAHHRGRPEVPLAVKVVKGRGDTDRLLLEPAMLSKLNHPCIVGLDDYFLSGDDLVLALEYIDGVDLKRLLDEGQAFDEDDVRGLLVQMASALAAAHARNILHRDLKPANVLATRGPSGAWRFVLTDFGIGQVREGIQSEKQGGGTYLFMAPEQLRGRPGPQSDLWALGVVAYRMLTGRMPFPGPTAGELTKQILYGQPPPMSRPDGSPVSPGLERIVLGLLDKSLSERTASAEELLRQLGHSGPADTVPEARPRRAGPAGGASLDGDLRAGITFRVWLIALLVLAYLLPQGLIAGALVIGGLSLFFVSQRTGRWLAPDVLLMTLIAYLLLAMSLVLRYVPGWDVGLGAVFGWLAAGLQALERWLKAWAGPAWADTVVLFLTILWVVLTVVWFFVPVIAGAYFAGLRRLQREKALRDLAREGDAGSEEYLQALRLALDGRFEDVGLHLKYAEALYARGRIAEAAAEARLLLRQDPYNFAGNLLLANAYLALGLHPECVEACGRYLEVSGYCFELAELREQGLRRAAP